MENITDDQYIAKQSNRLNLLPFLFTKGHDYGLRHENNKRNDLSQVYNQYLNDSKLVAFYIQL